MKYLKKYEDVNENYISDIFYSLRAYNLFYISYINKYLYLVELEIKDRLIVNDSMEKELIDKLTLQLNRSRQAIITTELTEIISGAEAL